MDQVYVSNLQVEFVSQIYRSSLRVEFTGQVNE